MSSCYSKPTEHSKESGHLLPLDQQGRTLRLPALLLRGVCLVSTRLVRFGSPRAAPDLQAVCRCRRSGFGPWSTQFNHVSSRPAKLSQSLRKYSLLKVRLNYCILIYFSENDVIVHGSIATNFNLTAF